MSSASNKPRVDMPKKTQPTNQPIKLFKWVVQFEMKLTLPVREKSQTWS